MLEKTLESPLEEIKLVYPKANKYWILIKRTNAEAEALILWLTDGKSQFIRKYPDAWKDKAVGGGDSRVWDGWMVPPTQWTSV